MRSLEEHGWLLPLFSVADMPMIFNSKPFQQLFVVIDWVWEQKRKSSNGVKITPKWMLINHGNSFTITVHLGKLTWRWQVIMYPLQTNQWFSNQFTETKGIVIIYCKFVFQPTKEEESPHQLNDRSHYEVQHYWYRRGEEIDLSKLNNGP